MPSPAGCSGPRIIGFDPADVHHDDPHMLMLTHQAMPRSLIAAAIGLLAPLFTLMALLAWPLVLEPVGKLARSGLLLWQLGMILVVAQDGLALHADADWRITASDLVVDAGRFVLRWKAAA